MGVYHVSIEVVVTRIVVPVLTYLRLAHKLTPAWDRQAAFEELYHCRIIRDIVDRRAIELEFDDEVLAMMFALQYGD